MIILRGLEKSYGKHRVLKGLDLEVKKGEVYGFIGQNGAGKTTTMNIIAGLISYSGGECIVNGDRAVAGVPARIGYLPENPGFYVNLTGLEYLVFLSKIAFGSVDRKRTDEILSLVNLKEAAKRRIRGYSRGMKQRLGLAAALLPDPELLVLDEPSSALDPEGRRDMAEIILKLKGSGKTLFLSTHILSDIERVCDRIGILHKGKLVLENGLTELRENYTDNLLEIEFLENPDEKIFSILKEKLNAEKSSDCSVSVRTSRSSKNSIAMMKVLSDLKLPVKSIIPQALSLEEVFLDKVNNHEDI